MIPTGIKIGAVTYRVDRVADLRDGDTGLNGWIRYNTSEILVDAALSEPRAAVTLLHEVVHGIVENAGRSMEEQAVRALAFGLAHVTRDNPEMVPAVREMLEGEDERENTS